MQRDRMASGGPEDAARRAWTRHSARAAAQGRGAACLIERAAEAEEGLPRRREEVLEWAVGELGFPEDLAEQVYDVAREEGVEPGLAAELVYCGVTVIDPFELDLDENAPASTTSRPDWVDTPLPAGLARRERRMRMSFRRLRNLLERHDDPVEALAAFAREPDVGDGGY